jgi:hypothetical protein
MKRRRFIYHYHAVHYPGPGQMQCSDGLARWEARVLEKSQVDAITNLIAETNGWAKAVLVSLTYLGRERWITALRRGGVG